MRVACRLRRHAVRVVGNDRIQVGAGEFENLRDHPVEGFGEGHRAVAHDRNAHGGKNVLARAAGVDRRHFRIRRGDEKRLVRNVGGRTLRRIRIARLFNGVYALRREAKKRFIKKTVSSFNDNRRLVDGGNPEELIMFAGHAFLFLR